MRVEGNAWLPRESGTFQRVTEQGSLAPASHADRTGWVEQHPAAQGQAEQACADRPPVEEVGLEVTAEVASVDRPRVHLLQQPQLLRLLPPPGHGCNL